jgi:protein-tyrosine phosphatase
VGLTARAMSDDARWCFENLRADRSNPLLLTESPWRMALGWLRPLAGREVWDGWSLRDGAVGRGELLQLLRERLAALFGRLDRHAATRRALAQHAVLLREGALSQPVSSVLFMCLGNLCRSPFAAAVASARLPGVTVESAGFLRHDGRPSPPHIVAAARALGFDVSDARARQVTDRHIEAADVVVVMDLRHLELMAREFPEALPKTTLLGLFAPAGPAEISDPYEFSPAATHEVLEQIVRAVDGFAALQPARPAPPPAMPAVAGPPEEEPAPAHSR